MILTDEEREKLRQYGLPENSNPIPLLHVEHIEKAVLDKVRKKLLSTMSHPTRVRGLKL